MIESAPRPAENIEQQLPFLTDQDFFKSPKQEEIEAYKMGDQITRNNFISFLAFSYAISKGSRVIHYGFFEFASKFIGHDIYKTLASFRNAGGWGILTGGEKKLFRDAMGKFDIEGHKAHVLNPEEARAALDAKIAGDISLITSQEDWDLNHDSEFFDVSNITDFASFRVEAAKRDRSEKQETL